MVRGHRISCNWSISSDMGKPHVLIMNHGGLRSLVATKLVVDQAREHDARVTLFHAIGGLPSSPMRLRMIRRQAEHFGIERVIEQPMQHLFSKAAELDAGRMLADFVQPQLLTAAMAQALRLRVQTLVWPAQANTNTSSVASLQTSGGEGVARVSQLAMQVETLADFETEGDPKRVTPRIDLPLLEMDLAGLIQLGDQLQVPWALAWSCLRRGEGPCGTCAGCRARNDAFAMAGVSEAGDLVGR